jgi:hypothetical protein
MIIIIIIHFFDKTFDLFFLQPKINIYNIYIFLFIYFIIFYTIKI